MENARRRKRRKSPSRTRSRTGKRAVQALAAGAMIAAGTQAYGEPIRFDNPPGSGHFVWYGGTGDDAIGLDMLLPAEEQTGVWVGPNRFGQVLDDNEHSRAFSAFNYGGLQVSGPYGDMLTGVASGDPIPSGLSWLGQGYIWYAGAGGYSYLPEGEQTYLGVRFPMEVGGDLHYGWIGVVRQNTVELDAFAWGYETEAGVPIPAGIPEPGTLAGLALGAAALLRRRRCRSQID